MIEGIFVFKLDGSYVGYPTDKIIFDAEIKRGMVVPKRHTVELGRKIACALKDMPVYPRLDAPSPSSPKREG
jgi:hypothetical protein